jgi:hypothetical protein
LFVVSGTPGMWVQNRLDLTLELYALLNTAKNPIFLVVTGADGAKLGITEADSMKKYVVERGIPAGRVLTDCQAV